MSSATDHQEARVHAGGQRARAALEEYLREVLILHAVRADTTDAKRARVTEEFLGVLDQQIEAVE